jgi:hypothetical protein
MACSSSPACFSWRFGTTPFAWKRGVIISALPKADRYCARIHAGSSKSHGIGSAGHALRPTGEPRAERSAWSAVEFTAT